MASQLVISLDFELMWGVRDHADISAYGRNVLGERIAIPRMLDLFERYGVRATWATVGMVFCESKEELLASTPSLRPSYRRSKLSSYSYFAEVGENEKADPYYFGKNLLDRISSCPGQEIGSHSFSHYYCLEDGQTLAEFEADIDAAIAIAGRRGTGLKSFVFPRNQYSEGHLEVLRRKGLKVFRGNERSWVYRPTDGAGQTKLLRASRLADHYVNFTGNHVQQPLHVSGLTEVASSRFLRPHSRMLSPLDPLRLVRITSALDEAASTDGIFHLWWHPHNFGLNVDENIAFLTRILDRFRQNQDSFGMTSANMGDFE